MTAEAWNAVYPIGTKVRYHPVKPFGSMPAIETETRSKAWAFGGYSAVVALKDKPGSFNLDHLEVITTDTENDK